MKDNVASDLNRRIAIIAKYSFYFDDVVRELNGLNIQIVSASEISEIQKQIESGVKFDFIFFPHYSKVIPSHFLEFQNCIGFHTGDLPKDRGGSPIQNKILRGEYSTWVSAFKIVEEIDAGDILCKESISLENGSIKEILNDVSKIISRLILNIVTNDPIPFPQIGTYSIHPRVNRQESELNLEDLDVRQIYDRIRMVDGLDYPLAYIKVGRYRILLSEAKLRENTLTFVSRLKEEQ